jgi:hypothetical protein
MVTTRLGTGALNHRSKKKDLFPSDKAKEFIGLE